MLLHCEKPIILRDRNIGGDDPDDGYDLVENCVCVGFETVETLLKPTVEHRAWVDALVFTSMHDTPPPRWKFVGNSVLFLFVFERRGVKSA